VGSQYDRQLLRARRAAEVASVTTVAESEDAAKAALRAVSGVSREERWPEFQNGAQEAVNLIAETFPTPRPGASL